MNAYIRKVQYYETDMMGVVHHANYIRWMEEARIDFIERLGFPYAGVEAKGIVSPVTSLSCDYKRPCTFGDTVRIAVFVAGFNGVVLSLRYHMERASDGETVCEARSEHVFLNREGRFVRLKRELPEFAALLETLAREGNDHEQNHS